VVSEVRVPYLDLACQHEPLRDEFLATFRRIADSGRFVLGKEVEGFEDEFAAYCGVGHAVAVNSGTSALHLALMAAGVGPGDEVVTSAMTFVATVAAITYVGAKPVLADVDPVTFCIDPDAVESAVTPRTKAIVPVHLFGEPADMAPLLALAERSGLLVIEDAAQAHGALYRGKRAGSLGKAAAFSFYPGKNLGAFGEGGAVVTDDGDLADRVRSLRDWGQSGKGNHVLRGFNYRMDAIQGAVLRIKLRHLDDWNDMRRSVAAIYDERLADTPLVLPGAKSDCRHVYHVYAVRDGDRDRLREWLAGRGIQSGVHYAQPVHLAPAYADLRYRRGDFPVAESITRNVLSLPVFPGMSKQQVELVVDAIHDYFDAPDGRGEREDGGATARDG